MNDQRFAELLNLRLDHEITPAQTAEFETEITRSPARRRHYHAYLRMHHASVRLFDHKESLAPASFALEKARLEAERKAAGLTRPAVRRPLTVAFAGLAAMAAGIALVFMRPASAPSSAVGPVGPASRKAVAATAPTPADARSTQLTNFAGQDLQASALAVTRPAATVGLTRVELPTFAPPMELPPIQPVVLDDFVVQPRLTMQPSMAISRDAAAPLAAAHTAAFQFQR